MDSVAAERAELEKALEEIDRQLRAVRERLTDPGFRDSAKPAQRAEQERIQGQLRAQRERVEKNLVTLLERRPGGLPSAHSGTWSPLAMYPQTGVEQPPMLPRTNEPAELSHHIAEILRSGASETRQIQALRKCVELAEEHVPTLELILAALEGFPIPGLGQELRLLLAKLTGTDPPPEQAPLAVETIPLSAMPEADALPDPRDGLTRMERLMLSAMWACAFRYGESPKPPSVLFEALHKGDAAITAERIEATFSQLMQPWSEKHPLVASIGNCWVLTELGEELFHDLDSARDLDPAFDFKAPRVLPVRIPLLLAKGTDAVPPHDLGELLRLAIRKLDATGERVSLKSFAGPDFPTGGALCEFPFGLYDWGRGQVVIRGKTSWEHEQSSNRVRLTISELPWPLRADEIIPQLQKLPGVVSVTRTESVAEQELILVELAHVAYARGLWNSLGDGAVIGRAFEVELRVNDGGKAAIIGLDQVLEKFLGQRREFAKVRVARQLTEMRERAHVLEGFVVAIDSLELMRSILRDCSPEESVWRLTHLTSPELKSRVGRDPEDPETLRALAKQGLRSVRRKNSELFESIHSYEPGFSEAQAREVIQVVATPPNIYRTNLIGESIQLSNRYEKLRSEAGWKDAVHQRVRGQLERLVERYKPTRHTMDANRAKSKVDGW